MLAANVIRSVFIWKGSILFWGWSAGAKVSCILYHWGIQLILAYSWARPAILVASKGRGGEWFYFFWLFAFFPVPLSFLFLSFISSTISVLPFSGRLHKMTHKGWRVIKTPTQSIISFLHLFAWYSQNDLVYEIYTTAKEILLIYLKCLEIYAWTNSANPDENAWRSNTKRNMVILP